MRRALTGAALLLLAGTAVAGQDVELRARGRALPPGYYERIAREPGFFEIDRGWKLRTQFAQQSSLAVAGRLPLVVIQVLFADSPEPSIEPDAIQRTLFDGPAPYGTLTQFYREVSGNRLEVSGRVLPWVRTQITRAETVGSSYALGSDSRMGTFLVQALQAADPLVDFGLFDNDGPDGVPNSGDDDGYVDAAAFQFIEIAASCGGNGIWPHRSRVSGWGAQTGGAYRTGDPRTGSTQPILVNDYIVQSTLDCNGGPQTAGTIAHEMGHVLGLPDLYHAADGILPSQRRWVLGCWTLMAAGSWGCGDGSTHGAAPRPSHMGPWEKAQLQWITEQNVGVVREQEYVLEPVQTSGRSLRVPITTSEYFQIEYRPRIGFDADLPASGVLIYHVDMTRPLYPSATGARIYRISLEEADGDGALLKNSNEGGNRGVAGDAWAVNGPASFTNLTLPSTTRNSGLPSPVTIHSIVIANGVARVRLTSDPTPALIGTVPAQNALAAFSHRVYINGGAAPYTWRVEGALPTGVSVSATGDTLHVSGTPLQAGSFPVYIQITDAAGTVAQQPLALSITPAALDRDRLLQPFLRSSVSPPTPSELTYLDEMGNRNGRYDVGDLRRQLRR